MAEPDRRRIIDAETAQFRPGTAREAAVWLLREPRRQQLLYLCLDTLGRSASHADAEDVLQDFLINSLQNVCRLFDPARGTFFAYFCVSLRNECRQRSRRLATDAKRRRAFDDVLLTVPAAAENDDGADWRQELRDRIERAQADLEPRARLAIQLHHHQGKTVEEVGAALGVHPNHAKVILHRGRQDLVDLVRWEAVSLLQEDHVLDWPSLCTSLLSARRSVTVAGVLWQRLDDVTRERLQRMVAPDARITAADRAIVVRSVNAILPQADLWPKGVLDRLKRQNAFPQEAQALLRKRKELGPIATLRLNRLILEFGLDGLIASSSTGRTDHGTHE